MMEKKNAKVESGGGVSIDLCRHTVEVDVAAVGSSGCEKKAWLDEKAVPPMG
jgi:hypothetical protein